MSGSYVETGDISTWYDEFGAGAPLVLLHPGLVDSRALADMVPGSPTTSASSPPSVVATDAPPTPTAS